MSDYDPSDLCVDCGKPYSSHPDFKFADLVERSVKSQEQKAFDAAVNRRAAAIVDERHHVQALAQWKLDRAHGIVSPRPRSASVDAGEIAFLKAYEREKSYQQLVARKVHEMKMANGTGSLVQVPANAPNRMDWFNGVSVKDASADDRFETRDAF